MQEREIKSIKLIYEDGAEKEIDKGFLCSMLPTDHETIQVTFDMVNISGKDLSTIIGAVIQFGMKIGYFGGEE
jgi:hypothetical protein